MDVHLKCIDCGAVYEAEPVYRCDKCGGLLDAVADIESLKEKVSRELFDKRLGSKERIVRSGVWRFRELVHPLVSDSEVAARPEGNTGLYRHKKTSEYAGVDALYLKHEGENPSGSFKDRGMTVGVSEALRQKKKVVACASTGNTSASMAAYASMFGLQGVVFIPDGEIAYGKLSQALAYGAKAVQIKGNFDDAMRIVQESADKLGMYLLNSINPWRVEGQKTIIFEAVQQLMWEAPDWIAVPAGNLGNTSAFGKAIEEMYALGLIDRKPRIASIQAEGANPFYSMWKDKTAELEAVKKPDTIATAIKIGNPVSWKKAMRAVKGTGGVVEEVSDQEIMDAKAMIDGAGIGCEPASAASVAGVKKLRESGVIDGKEKVVCIVTGNILKDPDATVNYHLGKLSKIKSTYQNMPVAAEADIESVKKALGK